MSRPVEVPTANHLEAAAVQARRILHDARAATNNRNAMCGIAFAVIAVATVLVEVVAEAGKEN